MAHDDKVIAFEMEGSGLWDACPTIIVKGVSDYVDSHKRKDWQRFAAVTAAATAKALLMSWTPCSTDSDSGDQLDNLESSIRTLCPTSSSTSNTQKQSLSLSGGNPVWMVPFDHQASFIGRVEARRDMINLLSMTNTCNKIAIAGLGGIGKTRLCLEIAYYTRQNHPERSVYWLQCSDVASFEYGCRVFAEKLDLPGSRDRSRDPKSLLKEYLDKDDTADWLLILDSADDEKLWSANATTNALHRYIPRGQRGMVLLTTRVHRIAFDIAHKNIIELNQLSHEESRLMLNDLLKNPVPNDADTTVTLQLLDYLTHLPLAIVQAAAYINQHHLSVREYLQVWKNDKEDEIIRILSANFTNDIQYQDAPNPVAKTWLISFKAIQDQHPLAAKVLSYMSCLHHQDMPTSSIPDLPDDFVDQLEAFGTLQSYAFVQRQGTDETAYSMHRLVQLAMKNYLRGNNSLADFLRTVAGHLRTLVPESGIDDTYRWQRHLPHIEKVVATTEIQNEVCYVELLGLLGRIYYADGSYVKSLNHQRSLVERLSKQSQPDQIRTMKNLAVIADILRQLGRGSESIRSAEEALRLAKLHLPRDSYENVSVIECLARSYGIFGNQKKALEHSKEAVELARHCKYPNEDLETRTVLSAIHTLSLHQWSLQQYQDQRETLGKAIKVAKKLKREVDKAQFEMALASAYFWEGDRTISILLRVREVFEKQYTDHHRLTLSSISRLARVYSTQHQHHIAEDFYRDLLDKYFKAGRYDDAQVINDRMQFALVLFAQGKLEEARDIQVSTPHLATVATGKESAITLKMLEVLATIHWQMKRKVAALTMMKTCFERSMTASTLGPLHPDTVDRLWRKLVWTHSQHTNDPDNEYDGFGIWEFLD